MRILADDEGPLGLSCAGDRAPATLAGIYASSREASQTLPVNFWAAF